MVAFSCIFDGFLWRKKSKNTKTKNSQKKLKNKISKKNKRKIKYKLMTKPQKISKIIK